MDRARLLLSCLMVGVVVILGGCYLNFLEPLEEAEGVEVIHDGSLAGIWTGVPEASDWNPPDGQRWYVQDTGDSSYKLVESRKVEGQVPDTVPWYKKEPQPQGLYPAWGKVLEIEGSRFWTVRAGGLGPPGAQPVSLVYRFERPSPDRVILYGLDTQEVRENLQAGRYDNLNIRFLNRDKEPLLILGDGSNRVEFLTRLVEEGRFNEKIVYERVSEPEGNE